ncbi:MAG: exodeoxyribonuclease VII large subunit, partial [Acidobacteria bacterium]|nr:exodeoxyribonuclease VII large subunit [Acidobacteriota bacterium]
MKLPFEEPAAAGQQTEPRRRVYKVSELSREIRNLLERAFGEIWVEGEISNFRPQNSGHYYFTLKDKEAQLRCVCFRSQNRFLKFIPQDGMSVLARGRVSVYEPRGEYQMVVESLEPLGVGSLQLAFEQLKEKLQKEGLFDPAHKKKLPLLPRKVGIVTSPTGAAIRDMLRVLQRRNRNVHVLIFPVKVQGEGAATEIATAIRYLNRMSDLDVLIVGR